MNAWPPNRKQGLIRPSKICLIKLSKPTKSCIYIDFFHCHQMANRRTVFLSGSHYVYWLMLLNRGLTTDCLLYSSHAPFWHCFAKPLTQPNRSFKHNQVFNNIYVYVHICMHVCMYVCMRACMYVCVNVCMVVHVRAYVRMYACMYTCIL